jgi:hypothetical protein
VLDDAHSKIDSRTLHRSTLLERSRLPPSPASWRSRFSLLVAMRACAPRIRTPRAGCRRAACATSAQSDPVTAPPAPVSPAPASQRRLPPSPTRLRNFVHIDDLSAQQLGAVLARAQELKAAYRAGDSSFQPLKGKSMAMIFAKPSLRTRVSFETVRGRASSCHQKGVGLRRTPRLSHAWRSRRARAAGLCGAGRPRGVPGAQRHTAGRKRRDAVRTAALITRLAPASLAT